MPVVESLEWDFEPPDYFEQSFEVVRDDYTLTVEAGKARVLIPAERFESDLSLRDKVHAALNDRFLAVQALTFWPYKLSDSHRIRLHPDGRRDVFIELKSATAIAIGGTVDIRYASADGRTIVDTKAERVADKRKFAEQIEQLRPRSPVLAAMLASFGAATRDPQNELVHLYEVREALATELQGSHAAMRILGIPREAWSRLGELCNDLPLRQGRHRGRMGVALRDATHEELEEARSLARSMLRSYVQHLQGESGAHDG
jgi:hypothetical protein